MNLQQQQEHYNTHPPRCLAAFIAESTHLPGVEFDGHGEELNTAFRLACSCGRREHRVLGYYWHNPDFQVEVFLSPLALRCDACGTVEELIDTAIHGYDGEYAGMPATMRGEGERSEYACAACGPQPFEIYVRFEYPDDLFEDEDEEIRGREHDLFTWFSLVGQCQRCEQLRKITDFECA